MSSRFAVGDYVRVKSNVRDKKSGAFGGYEGRVTEVVGDNELIVDFFMHGLNGRADGRRTVPAKFMRFDSWNEKHDPALDADS